MALAFLLMGPALALAQPGESVTEDPAAEVAVPSSRSDADKARLHLAELDTLRQELASIRAAGAGSEGEEWELLKVSALAILDRFMELDKELAAVTRRLAIAGAPTDSVHAAAGEHLQWQLALLNQAIRTAEGRLSNLGDRRGQTAPADLNELETMVTQEHALVNRLLGFGVQTALYLEDTNVESPRNLQLLDQALTQRAERLAGRLQLATMEQERIRDRLDVERKAGTAEQELTDDRIRLSANQQRIGSISASLDHASDLLATLGHDVSVYRQVVLQATGEITDKILDPRVMVLLVTDGLKRAGNWLEEWGPTGIVKLLILVACVVLSRLLVRILWLITQIFWSRSGASRLFRDLVGRMINPLATVAGFVFGLWVLGVDPTTLLTGVGVLSVIVGLALQDSLGNLAAGMFILIYRPFDVDDAVSAGGVTGVVRTMGLANTTIVTFDNRRLYVPNRKIWSEVIENRSVEIRRRVNLEIRISYRQDLDAAFAVIRGILHEHALVLADPEPQVFVAKQADSWLEIAVWPWASTENWWSAVTALPKELREGLTEAGIPVPYPRREVEMRGGGDLPGPEA